MWEHVNFLQGAVTKLIEQRSHSAEAALLLSDAASMIEELDALSSLLPTRFVTKKLTKKWLFSVIMLT